MNLRVGRIPFLVCTPFFHADFDSSSAGPEFLDGPPSLQNQRLSEGLIHMAPSSSFAYALKPGQYWIVPEICTGSTLEIRSVKLFSNLPLERLNGRPVSLTPQSATSINLLKLLCEVRFGIFPQWVTSPTEPIDAKLLIGDEALLETQNGSWPYQYDLATLWQEWQGLPFVFGMWIVHQSALKIHQELTHYRQHLLESVATFRQAPEAALTRWLSHYPSSLSLATLLQYYQIVDYRFTEEHKRSLELFYQLCFASQLIPAPPPLRFLPE